MPFATLNNIPLRELKAMARGQMPDTITDMDFLETLASWHCLLVVPWVLRLAGNGRVEKVTRVIYTVDGELDKARILFEVAREFRRARAIGRLGTRFSVE
jgi:hypothetical protein